MIIIIPEGVSPGTRGCTNAMHSDCPKVNGLPRHTGLHREATTGSPLPRRSPPAHGAAPGTVSISEAIKTVSPGTRGCTQSIAVDGLMAWSPPTHGAAPVYPTAHWCGATVSPGTRGCTPVFKQPAGYGGLPRQTGLHLTQSQRHGLHCWAPPAHGAAPDPDPSAGTRTMVSPGTRGCTVFETGGVARAKSSPAHGAAPQEAENQHHAG